MKSLCFALGLLFFLPSKVIAKEATLKAGVILEKPWAYHDNNGVLHGLAVTYFKELALELGKPISIHAVPAKRLMRSIKMGKFDLSIIFIDPEWKSMVTTVTPIFRVDTILIGRRGLNIEGYSSEEDLRLAHVRGTTSGSWLEKSNKVRKVFTSNYSETIWLLKQKRVDVIAGSYPVLKSVLKEQKMSWEELSKPHFLSCRFVMVVFSNRSPEFSRLQSVQDAANRFKKSPKWNILLDDISRLAPSMLEAHIHEDLSSY